jgi:hypothetical protein
MENRDIRGWIWKRETTKVGYVSKREITKVIGERDK